MDGEVISYTHPARARKLLKNGIFVIHSKKPFVVMRTAKEGIVPKRKAKPITNFTQYFRDAEEVGADIYVQNISSTQISMTFYVGVNQIESVVIPETKDPYNLCQDVPMSVLKESMDLRKLVNRRPEVLRLLSEEEYVKYYELQAAKARIDTDEAISRALEKKNRLMRKIKNAGDAPKTLDQLALERNKMDEEAEPEVQIHPRIVGLCAQVGAGIKQAEMLKAETFLEKLEDLQDSLEPQDLDYLVGNGYWKTVTGWAAKEQSRRLKDEGEE